MRMTGARPTTPSHPLPAGYGIARSTRSVWSGVLIGVGIAAFVAIVKASSNGTTGCAAVAPGLHQERKHVPQ